MPNYLLDVPHRAQLDEAGCLLACVEIVTTYLGRPLDQSQAGRLFESMSVGVPASRISRLERLGFSVIYAADATMEVLEEALSRGLPPIVFFNTDALEYWSISTDHAAVMIGLDDLNVRLNDPAYESAPQICSRDAFELAWTEFENRYALIALP
jgi:ABC-type bacteriocin/lantibiotic exporter with double-glycine peptidase domain